MWTYSMVALLLAVALGAQGKPATPAAECSPMDVLFRLSPEEEKEFKRQQMATLAIEWAEARRMAKNYKVPILVFVLPAADAKPDPAEVLRLCKVERREKMLWYLKEHSANVRTARDLLLRSVQLLRGTGQQAHGPSEGLGLAQSVFALTIPVFAKPEACGAKRGENVVLLQCDGKREAAWSMDLLDRDAFARTLMKVVGSERQLLARRANIPAQLLEHIALVHKGFFGQTANERQRSSKTEDDWWIKAREYLPVVAPALLGSGNKGDAATLLCRLEESRPPLGCSEGFPHLRRGIPSTPIRLETTLWLVPDSVCR